MSNNIIPSTLLLSQMNGGVYSGCFEYPGSTYKNNVDEEEEENLFIS